MARGLGGAMMLVGEVSCSGVVKMEGWWWWWWGEGRGGGVVGWDGGEAWLCKRKREGVMSLGR